MPESPRNTVPAPRLPEVPVPEEPPAELPPLPAPNSLPPELEESQPAGASAQAETKRIALASLNLLDNLRIKFAPRSYGIAAHIGGMRQMPPVHGIPLQQSGLPLQICPYCEQTGGAASAGGVIASGAAAPSGGGVVASLPPASTGGVTPPSEGG